MTTSETPTISRIDIAEATFTLPEPLTVGGGIVTGRDYTFVRVVSSSGEEGYAYGITRRLPVAAVIERIVAPLYLGEAVGRPTDIYAQATRNLGSPTDDSCVMRALSLLDIAVWDLSGKEADRPVCELMGGGGSTPGLMTVDGYLPASGEISGTRRRVEHALESGISTVKFAYRGDPGSTRTAIERVAPEALDGSLSVVVDLLWTMGSVADGRAVSDALDGVEVAWIEDPFPGRFLRERDVAREAFHQRIAFGDEVTDPYLLRDLAAANRTDVVRVDATTIGGLTGAAAVIKEMHVLGHPVGCHIYPEVHQHLAYSPSVAEYVEMFPVDGRFDAADRFRTATVDVAGGTVTRPTEPGLGLGLDWEAIGEAGSSFKVIKDER